MELKVVETTMIKLIRQLKGLDFQSQSRLFDEVGLDSLDVASIIAQTEQELGMTMGEDGIDWRNVSTVADLAQVFLKHVQR